MALTVLGFPDSLAGKESACNVGATGDMGLIPGLERSLGEDLPHFSEISQGIVSSPRSRAGSFLHLFLRLNTMLNCL